MTPNLRAAFSKENLLRSWNWVNSTNNREYKQFFRSLYKAYGLSAEENLKDLKSRLDQGIYQPSQAIKIYSPKKSGILRAYTLLNVEDQIVYQAFVNIIAKKYYPFTPINGVQISFSHRYTSENHTFFYKRWTKGYKLFNKRVIDAYDSGFNVAASFDLAAFYDSICHKVLGYTLTKLRFEPEFINAFSQCLEAWSSTDDKQIIHGHGIPQGPFTSGIVAELILNNFDEAAQFEPFGYNDMVYSRYVDDIKLMAKDEYRLRKCLVQLDYISKNLGLFPQSGKIDIRKIDDIFDEIKSVSMNPLIAELMGEKLVTQKDILNKINELIKGGRLKDETTFKYLLGHAKPTDRLNRKLLKILNKSPHLYNPILNHIDKARRIGKVASDMMFTNANYIDIYEEVTTKYMKISIGKIHEDINPEFVKLAQNLHKRMSSIKSPELRSIIIVWLMNNNSFNYAAMEFLVNNEHPRVVQNILEHVNIDMYGRPSYEHLINRVLQSKDTDTALKAAYICVNQDLKVDARVSQIHYLAQIPLKRLGKIGRRAGRRSTIGDTLGMITDNNSYSTDWKSFFGARHKDAESKSFICRSYVQNDATAFVNQLDVFHDLLLNALFAKDTSIGGYQLGSIGSVLHAPTGRFAIKYPKLFAAVSEIHKFRYKSQLSHPLVKGTNKVTTRIKFNEIKMLKPILHAGYTELIANM